MSFRIHQDKTRGIPEFVAKIAVAFAALKVEVDIATQCCISGHGEAQCIGAVGREAFGVVFARTFFNAGGLAWVHQADCTFGHQRLQIDSVDQVNGIDGIAL